MNCLALLTCEKVIIDKEGAPSLNVMTSAKIKVQAAEDGKIEERFQVPANAMMPLQWFIYTRWNPAQEDIGKDFEQVYQIFWPNGEKLSEYSLPFKQTNDKVQRTSYSIVGFRVRQKGTLKVITWLNSEGQRISSEAETYMYIEHEPVSANTGGIAQ